ncbi:MAG TPA: ATP-binding protein [Dongiaceae bacterium]|nr:ATP-binding protein [Dongiaceae bacterium]
MAIESEDVRGAKESALRGGRWRLLWARLSQGIGARLLVRVVLFSSAITLILTALQLYLDYRRDVGIIDDRLAEIERSYLGSIGESLWQLDERQIALQLEGILRLPDIRAVEVREATNRPAPLLVTVGQRQERSRLVRVIPIMHSVRGAMQPIGSLYVEATLVEVYRTLINKALVILVSQGTKTFLVSLFIVYIFHRLVTRHLTSIAATLRSYDLLRPPPPLRLQRPPQTRPDELDQLVAAFNGVSARLQHAYDDLRTVNLQLEEDIRARRRAESALRESELRFRDYAETASDWFWETGPDHRFNYISDRAGEFGIATSGVIGHRRWDAATDLEDEPTKWRRHFRTLEHREPFRDFIYRIMLADGSHGFVSTSGKPTFDAGGGFLGYRGVGRDVTSTTRAEQALRDAKLQAETASRAKSDFLANMSHELRTPLNAIIGLSEMIRVEMLGPVANEQYRSYADDINASGLHLLGIINEILDLAKVEAGKMDLDIRLLSLGDIARDVLRILKTQADAMGLGLEVTIAADLPRVHADEQAFRRILFNLLSNAFKFTPSGGKVAVWLGREPTGEIRLSVADTGIGIAPENIPKLMQPFVQIENVYKRRTPGAGLGLAIVRSLVERHGGTVVIESELDEGTRIVVTLPAKLVASAGAQAASE